MTLESRESSATMMPLAYQPIDASRGWMIIAHEVSFTPVTTRPRRGKGKSISALLAKRRDTSPEAAKSLRSARNKLANIMLENQAESLQSLRLQKGLSQSELALLMGTQQSYIARIEKNSQDLRGSTIKKLANALGVTCDQIIEVTENHE